MYSDDAVFEIINSEEKKGCRPTETVIQPGTGWHEVRVNKYS